MFTKNLTASERIEFKIAILTYKNVHGLAPRCLSPFTMSPTYPLIAAFCRHQSPASASADCHLLIAVLFWSPARRLGMTSWKTWQQRNHWPHFIASSRHICSRSLLLTTCWTLT